MVICCDTSFLFSLYGNDPNTGAALGWVRNQPHPLRISKLNQFELANALRFAEFRKALPPGTAVECLADFETDLEKGLLQVENCNLAEILDEAGRISAAHTLAKGTRSFDILHVAAALKIGATTFLTFDRNQRQLAEAEELVAPL